ncbi:MAG: HU family DNA-binding protein [bacterium]|nr:HU family DNA-binding protein [bacterium]
MNKAELIEAVSSRTGMARVETEKTVEAAIDIITETLKGGGEVTLTGFGNFSVSHRAPRTGVNPQNPTEKIQIGATKVPKFKAGKGLKDAVRAQA